MKISLKKILMSSHRRLVTPIGYLRYQFGRGMAAGMAVITTKGTGCEEVVGNAGLLVESRNSTALKEAISKLINNQDLCKELGSLARRRFETNFNWDVITKKYCDVYKACSI